MLGELCVCVDADISLRNMWCMEIFILKLTLKKTAIVQNYDY